MPRRLSTRPRKIEQRLCRASERRYASAMHDDALLALAADLAEQAGAAILAIRARGFETRRKEDASPVTEADHAAERLIAAGLRTATPEIPVIAEEEMAAGHVPSTAEAYWLVDPLDGTREFAAGRDEFTVNVGLVRAGRAVLGAVGVPASAELFAGIVGQGAWKRDAAGTRPIAARPAPATLHVLASRSYGDDPRLTRFLAAYHVGRITKMGSALKICRLAEGVADLYPRFGRTMEWDTAAPQAVLEAAGGTLSGMTGERLRYGKPGWENSGFVCTGRLA